MRKKLQRKKRQNGRGWRKPIVNQKKIETVKIVRRRRRGRRTWKRKDR